MIESPWPRIGGRNLGRQRQRTLLTVLGLAVGYFACVFLIGWTAGIQSQMVENATALVNGQIEISDAEFRAEQSLYDTIGGRGGADVEALLRAVAADEAVVAAAPRVYAGSLVSSGESTVSGSLIGVDVAREVALTRFLDTLVDGALPVADRNELVVGEALGRRLEVGVGDELTLVGSGADGSLAADLYTVTGIFRTGLLDIDASTAVMPLGDLQTFMVLDPGRVHEIAVATVDPWVAEATAARLSGVMDASPRPLAVTPWTVLNPAIVDYVALGESISWVITAIVFSIVLFGVANTMLMATFERRREFAVMLALGATPRAVVMTVFFEALAVGVLSLALAATVTFPLMAWWRSAPPSLAFIAGEVTLMGALVAPDLRVEYDVTTWVWTAVALIVTALAGAVYPAARAARIPPADTLSGS